MIMTVKQGSGSHRNWKYLRDHVIYGLKYSWRRDSTGDYIMISISEEIEYISGERSLGGIGVTTGNLIKATQLAEVLGDEAFIKLINNTLNDSIYLDQISPRITPSYLGEILMGFSFRRSPEGFDFWSGLPSKVHRELSCSR